MDPLNFLNRDLHANIYAPLVSKGLDGRWEGLVASEWRVDAAGKVWRFKIRPGLTFDDSSPVTSAAVLKNFKRALWATRKQRLDLNILLPELSSWKRREQVLTCVYVEGEEIVFKLNRRPTDFLELLSDPAYGIANPRCFDENGAWRDAACASGSGQYKVEAIEPGRITLRSRHIFREAEHAPELVEFRVTSSTSSLIDLLLKDEGDIFLVSEIYFSPRTWEVLRAEGLTVTMGPTPDFSFFLQLDSRRPPFDDRAVRRSLRDRFLSCLKEKENFPALGKEVSPSFISEALGGHVEFPIAPGPGAICAHGEEVVYWRRPPMKYMHEVADVVGSCVERSLRQLGFRPRSVDAVRSPHSTQSYNISRKSVFALSSDPSASLRKVFFSWPDQVSDSSGRIVGLLQKAETASDPAAKVAVLQKINRAVFDEAEMIPFYQGRGVYVHRKGFDFSRQGMFASVQEYRAANWNPAGGKD